MPCNSDARFLSAGFGTMVRAAPVVDAMAMAGVLVAMVLAVDAVVWPLAWLSQAAEPIAIARTTIAGLLRRASCMALWRQLLLAISVACVVSQVTACSPAYNGDHRKQIDRWLI